MTNKAYSISRFHLQSILRNQEGLWRVLSIWDNLNQFWTISRRMQGHQSLEFKRKICSRMIKNYRGLSFLRVNLIKLLSTIDLRGFTFQKLTSQKFWLILDSFMRLNWKSIIILNSLWVCQWLIYFGIYWSMCFLITKDKSLRFKKMIYSLYLLLF